MIHAITRGKSRIYQRYLGRREHGELRVSEEDEITSLIMGPLAFMPSEAVGAFWTSLVERRNVDHRLPSGLVTFAEMYFWPKRYIKSKRHIEPDLLVELRWESGERRWLLVEFKWRAPLSGRDQLHRQWLEFLSNHERENAFHIFIAPEISEGHNALSIADVWGGKLLLYPWFDVLSTLRCMDKPGITLLSGWAEEVESLFQLLNIIPFRGFNNLSFQQNNYLTATLFWKAICGFENMSAPHSQNSCLGPEFLSDSISIWRNHE